jgi:hypothetical protein
MKAMDTFMPDIECPDVWHLPAEFKFLEMHDSKEPDEKSS